MQNLTFRFIGKTSAEIKAIADKHPSARIMRNDGVILAETVAGGCNGYVDGTNYIGLVLIFTNYDQAKIAAQTLRGD